MQPSRKIVKKKKELQTKPLHPHWRRAALELFLEHSETISDKSEEYAIYNLFFELRAKLKEAIAKRDTKTAAEILDFAGRCLLNEFGSDGEDISVAAGVSLFEHIFEDCPSKLWAAVFSCMPLKTYHASRHYTEQWMGADAFQKVAEAAKQYYTLRKPKS